MKIHLTYKIVFVIILMISFSCKTRTHTQEIKVDSTSSMESKKPKFSEKDVHGEAIPNTIEVIGEVIKLENNSIVCDKEYETVITIRAKKIVSAGSSIVNMLNEEKTFVAILSNKLFFKETTAGSIPNTKDTIQITILEELCSNSTKTIYFITSYKKL